MKRGAGKAKGGAFEREICVVLSEWWTSGDRDDVFYRSASSGGRATRRGAKRKATVGHYGDVAAMDEVGRPLLSLLVIECKTGYSGISVDDFIDWPTDKPHKLLKFVEQAMKSWAAAGSMSWMLIIRRYGKVVSALFPRSLWKSLLKVGVCVANAVPLAKVNIQSKAWGGGFASSSFVHMPLSVFLRVVSRQHVMDVLKEHQQQTGDEL